MSKGELLNSLREAGYRLTAPRRKLVDLLVEAELPLTAEELHQRARQAEQDANLSTVYRNLAMFCELGWLAAMPGANGERRYQLQSAAEQRVSVLCLDCGQMTSLQVGAYAPLNAAVREMGFDAHSLRVTLAARCDNVCAHKTN